MRVVSLFSSVSQCENKINHVRLIPLTATFCNLIPGLLWKFLVVSSFWCQINGRKCRCGSATFKWHWYKRTYSTCMHTCMNPVALDVHISNLFIVARVQQRRRNVFCTVVTAVPGMAIASTPFLSAVGVQAAADSPVESGKRLSKADMAQQESG